MLISREEETKIPAPVSEEPNIQMETEGPGKLKQVTPKSGFREATGRSMEKRGKARHVWS
jgi:hypothetical protein